MKKYLEQYQEAVQELEDVVQATESVLSRLEEVEDDGDNKGMLRNLNTEVGGHLPEEGEEVKVPEGGAGPRDAGQQESEAKPRVSKDGRCREAP